jgi:hypothetical protein
MTIGGEVRRMIVYSPADTASGRAVSQHLDLCAATKRRDAASTTADP